MQRVVWRAVFSKYLDEVNGEAPRSLAQTEAQREPPIPARAGPVFRARRFTARALRYASRLVDIS